MNFEEYRGVENLVIAELNETTGEDGKIIEKYGPVQRLSIEGDTLILR